MMFWSMSALGFDCGSGVWGRWLVGVGGVGWGMGEGVIINVLIVIGVLYPNIILFQLIKHVWMDVLFSFYVGWKAFKHPM